MYISGSSRVARSSLRFVRLGALATAAALPLAATAAHAQAIFDDRAAFLAAVASPLTFHANAFCQPAPPTCAQSVRLFAVGPLQVAGGAWWVKSVMPMPAAFGFQPDAPQGDAPFVTFRSPTPINAFGIDFAAPIFPPPSAQTVFSFSFDDRATFATGQQLPGGPQRPSFFGFVSPTPFTEIELTVFNVTEGTIAAANGATFDGLTIGGFAIVDVVPEPTTLALLGGGLAALGAGTRVRRRRRS